MHRVDKDVIVFDAGQSVSRMKIAHPHLALNTPLQPPFPSGCHWVLLGLGCFWGAERLLWSQPGACVTAVGYSGGQHPEPSYDEVCTGVTGHTEVVLLVYQPDLLDFDALLRTFWESHDPTQGMRQGNDVGSQYRSAIYCSRPEQLKSAQLSAERYSVKLQQAGLPPITTEIAMAGSFYYAEPYHQQYLIKQPGGYCGLKGTGVRCSG